ncbi:hypothetical protein CEE37_06545 [candidate division LCP-89 bacterium B3_LCP]|uniref:Aminopeptidase N n=1 Tax=candidate division LCP-89 bacterium B3_LCP TaxID=2012998 RepID=A0A532V0F5_UNCL8|nr:MAG: hypothetical protein CEE37_06545 [candidate division LCP-89 bacterium B3_LCP]
MRRTIAIIFLASLLVSQVVAGDRHHKPSFQHHPAIDADSVHTWNALHYEVQLQLTPISVPHNLFIEAVTEVHLTPEIENLEVVDMSLHNMDVASVTLEGVGCAYDLTNDTLYVTLPQPHNPGDTLILVIEYSGYPELTGTMAWQVGIYYPSANMIYTHADAWGARNWMPCWDEPWDKATIRQKLIFPSEWTVVANGTFEDSTSAGGWTRWTYYMNYPMTTYLISFNARTDYVTFEQTSPYCDYIRHFVYPGHLGYAQNVLERVPEMIDAFSGFFGDYPFDTFGCAETPLSGAMENQTIVNLGEWVITGQSEITVAHELGHMWFGDAVSYIDWPEMWLSEGFATYSEALWNQHLGGMSAYHQYVLTNIKAPYVSWQGFNPPYPTYDPPWELIWSLLTYEKPATVLHMLRFHLGDDLFFQSIQTYFDLYKHGNASTWDLAAAVQDVSGEDYDWYFDQWIFEGGYPQFEYFAAWEPEGDDILLRVPIAQVQDDELIDFRTDAELYIYSGGNTLIDTITIEALPTQEIEILLTDEPDSIELDPVGWILCGKTRLESITEPILEASDPFIDDQGGNGFLNSGELGDLSFVLTNLGLPTGDLTVELTSTDPTLTVLEATRYVPALSFYDQYDFSSDPFPVQYNSSGPRWVEFHAEVSEQGGGAVIDTLVIWLPAGAPELLLVDDDGGGSSEVEHQLALDNIRRVYQTVEYVHPDSLPPLTDYSGVIWACGEELTNTLTADDQSLLQDYLQNQSGALLLSGRGVVPDLQSTDFFAYVLHAQANGATASPVVEGADPLVSELYLGIWGDAANNDIVEPDGTVGADTLLVYFPLSQGCAVKYDGDYKTCVIGFGFEDIKRDDPLYDNPEDLLAPLMVWFTGYTGVQEEPVRSVLPTEYLICQNYPNPFNPTTVISFSLPVASLVKLEVFDINGRNVGASLCACPGSHRGLPLQSWHPPGTHQITFNGSDLSSGIYIYRLTAGEFTASGKMLLLK